MLVGLNGLPLAGARVCYVKKFLIAPGCRIPVAEVTWRFTTSSGPGGQHANKANTGVDARLDIANAAGITPDSRERLILKLGAEVRVYVDSERSQFRNRATAMDRMTEKLLDALAIEKPRRPTKRSKGSHKRRIKSKRQRSEIKKSRQRPRLDD